MPTFQDPEFIDAFNAIKQADLPEEVRLARAFDLITSRVLSHYGYDIEVARASQDSDLLVKHQIKLEVMKYARQIFEDSYRFMIGGSAWDV